MRVSITNNINKMHIICMLCGFKVGFGVKYFRYTIPLYYTEMSWNEINVCTSCQKEIKTINDDLDKTNI